MEIIGTNMSEKQQKNKKLIKIISIIIVMLMIVSVVLAATIFVLKEKQFKFIVDDQNIAQTEGMFIIEENNIYFSIKDMANLVGYKYYNGAYKQYSEDTDKCYVENEYEVCTFEKGSNKIYKTTTDILDYEYFTIDESVKNINGKLYTTIEGIEKACNLDVSYSAEQNKLTIYTLPYLVNYYTNYYQGVAIEKNFKNQKALLYGLLVVQDSNENENTSNYGVYSTKGESIVGTKYKDIEFIESTEEFIVTTEENKVGIITSRGDTKVRPQYDSLKQIDKDLNLYLATNNNKKGVIEKNGKILIYLEYDEIGIDITDFQNNDIKNSYILFNNAIPVKQGDKWGLYNIKGNLILPIEYAGFGCIAGTSSDKSANNILVIPDVEGIVVSKEYEFEEESGSNTKNKKRITMYGIVDSLGKELVPAALETVYSVTVNGKEEYTMINNNIKYDVLDYIRQYVNVQQAEIVDQQIDTENNTNTTNIQIDEDVFVNVENN